MVIACWFKQIYGSFADNWSKTTNSVYLSSIANANMKKSFPFLQEFRPSRGYDSTFLLDEDIDSLNELEDVPGVYIIEATDGSKFSCPVGKSSIIYIGKSDHLKTRLKEHRSILMQLWDNKEYGMKMDEPWVSSRYQFMRYHGARVYTYKCLKQSQNAKELEAQVIWNFYQKYRCLPIGNGAKSYSKGE